MLLLKLPYSYHIHDISISTNMTSIGKIIDSHATNYESVIIIGDLNAEIYNDAVNDFYNIYIFKHLMEEPRKNLLRVQLNKVFQKLAPISCTMEFNQKSVKF